MVPTEEFPPGMPFTCQLTAELEAFCTLARNCTLAPADICAEGGETLTLATGAGTALLVVEVPPPPAAGNLQGAGDQHEAHGTCAEFGTYGLPADMGIKKRSRLSPSGAVTRRHRKPPPSRLT